MHQISLEQDAQFASGSKATQFVFIVGVSRSGTSLMRRIMNSSDQIAISNENHFLGHLIASEGARYKFRRFGDLADDSNVCKLVDYIYSGGFGKSSKLRGLSYQWRWIIERVKKEEFLQRILSTDRSERALFMVMMQVFADRKGKPIAGEKTPAHIRYVPTILEWFPEARIIHMLRDPRGIFVSELRRRKREPVTTPYKQLKHVAFLFKVYILLQTTFTWLDGAYRYHKYKELYPDNYYLLRFEDLIREPEKYIKQVCDFLGVGFQEKMLEQMVISKGFQEGQAGFDAGAIDRWKHHIPPWIDTWFLLWFKKYLKGFGYAH